MGKPKSRTLQFKQPDNQPDKPAKKEERIAVLETKMQKMEENIEHQEQYSRRPNMRIHVVPEHDNEDTTTIVMDVINSKMSFKPQLESSQLDAVTVLGPN